MDVSDIRRIAVIGGGLIGHGIAQQFAQAGHPVGLYNRTDASRQQALARIRSGLQLHVELGLATPRDVEASLAHIQAETDLARAAEGADLVVEAVAEDLALKQAIFRQLDGICPPPAILATDTSGLSISQIAAATDRPERVIGTHHFNPPPLVPGVEVVPGERTSLETVDRTLALLRKVGKQPALVRDVPGFVAVRLSSALRREAWAIVEQGIATPEAVDTIWLTTVGRVFSAAGPLEVSDTSGLDILLAVHEYVERVLTPPSTPSSLVREKVERGDLGAKAGRGFYPWPSEQLDAATRRRARTLAMLRRQDQAEPDTHGGGTA